MGKIINICISEMKGTSKHPVPSIEVKENYGLVGDSHAGNWHRQVSFLDKERIDEFNARGALVNPGDFGENIIVEGLDINHLEVGSWLKCGDAIFEISQLGKECHDHCPIYYKMGQCIMPNRGTFAIVKQSGTIHEGDTIEVIDRDYEFPFQVAVITLSDKGFKGERKDESGPILVKLLKNEGFNVVETLLLPDGISPLKEQLIRLCDQRRLDLIITTGGTGFSPRDLTPEATLEVKDRLAPGISEALRYESSKYTPKAMLSRGVSVIRGKTLIINFPGSPKAVEESFEIIKGVLDHAIRLLRGSKRDCARIDKSK